MFDTTLLESSSARAHTNRHRIFSLGGGAFLEAVLLGLLLLIPLIRMEALPKLLWITKPPGTPFAGQPKAQPAQAKRRPARTNGITVPSVIPNFIPRFDEAQETPPTEVPSLPGLPQGISGSGGSGVPYDWLLGGSTPLPPPQPKASTVKRIKVSHIEAARIIYQPKPEYPPLAIIARIQGTVRIEALISKNGAIEDLKVLDGHPFLVKAALNAVARWRYQPTLLNGEPVEVLTEIDVKFTFSE